MKNKIMLSLCLSSMLLANNNYEVLSLEELMNTTVTTATKKEETFLSVPSSVTVFTKQDIESMGASIILDL
jgi:outer membrane cobalamin receptor